MKIFVLLFSIVVFLLRLGCDVINVRECISLEKEICVMEDVASIQQDALQEHNVTPEMDTSEPIADNQAEVVADYPFSSDDFQKEKNEVVNYYEPGKRMELLPKAKIGEILVEEFLPSGQHILLCHPAGSLDDFVKWWVIDRGEYAILFCEEYAPYESGYYVDIFENVLGQDGFRICGQRGVAYYYYDYWFFDEEGNLRFLAPGSNYLCELDLNDDGTKEILCLYNYRGAYYYYLENGKVYFVDLTQLVENVDGWAWANLTLEETEEYNDQTLPQNNGHYYLPLFLRKVDDWAKTRATIIEFYNEGIRLLSGQ